MDGYVAKPFDAQALLAAIDQVCPDVPPGPGHAAAQPASMSSARPTAPGATETPLAFDYAGALHLCNDDTALLARVATVFLATAPGLLAEIRQAVAECDCQKIRRGAHKLSGSAGVLGGQAVMQAAEALRNLAATGRTDAMPQACDELERQVQRLEVSLGSLVKEGTP